VGIFSRKLLKRRVKRGTKLFVPMKLTTLAALKDFVEQQKLPPGAVGVMFCYRTKEGVRRNHGDVAFFVVECGK